MQFGDKIKINGKLVRGVEYRDRESVRSKYDTRTTHPKVRWKVWKEQKLSEKLKTTDCFGYSSDGFFGLPEVTAVFLGKRTLSEGETYWEDECGWVYTHKNYFPAYLVCIKGWNRIFHVKPSQVVEFGGKRRDLSV